jgi:acyl-CoA synthetase (AMP-forming)/AMP-acid ligase II
MQSLPEMIEAQADSRPDHLALTGFGGDYTYAELRRDTWKVANAFIAAGFGNGTRFALFSPNAGCGVVAQLGSLKAGGVWCNVNLKNTVSDNIDILTRGGCEVFYYHSAVSSEALHIVASVPSIKLALCIDEANDNNSYVYEWISQAPDTKPNVSIDLENDIGWQGNTGGTTGLPKLTQSPHSFLAINAKAFVDLMPVKGGIRNLAVAPITHAGGIVLLGCLAAGATNFMMAAPTPEAIVEELESNRITTVFLPPTLVYVLLKYPGIESRDFSSLRYLLTAGAPMAAEKILEASQVFGNVLCQAFGQTEAGFPVTWISPEEVKEAVENESKRGRLSSCGKKCQVLDDLAIMDEDGRILPVGEQGEIVMRGPTIMTGYLNDPEATAEVQKFGWHHTGDVGYLDDEGYLYLCDRKRDLIISGGFNIFPYEVEQVLLTHPAVQECAVVGVNDEKWGERVTAAIELAPGAQINVQALMDYCKEKMGSMKAPKEIVIRDSLPRSAVGKVLKREIRRELNERT